MMTHSVKEIRQKKSWWWWGGGDKQWMAGSSYVREVRKPLSNMVAVHISFILLDKIKSQMCQYSQFKQLLLLDIHTVYMLFFLDLKQVPTNSL